MMSAPTLEQEDRPLKTKIVAENVDFFYGKNHVLHSVSLSIPANRVTALIGPSGCGKSTFLRCLNRMNDLIPTSRMTGRILLDDVDINDPLVDPVQLRREVGMVFQKPNPFPKSIYDNIAYGPRLHRRVGRAEMDELVERCLVKAALWDEVKDKLNQSGLSLSGGQQQRLCIARAIVVAPEVLLMDEPCSAIDPIATNKIEELIHELKSSYTIAIVTHNMQQAARVSDYTAFFFEGKIIEFGTTKQIFTNPTNKQTEEYITGRFG